MTAPIALLLAADLGLGLTMSIRRGKDGYIEWVRLNLACASFLARTATRTLALMRDLL